MSKPNRPRRPNRPRTNNPRGRTRAARPVKPTFPPIIVEVSVGDPAHGGHAVARHEGRVIFVRGAAPGERVRVEVDNPDPDAKFWRGRTISVLEASADRIDPVWPFGAEHEFGGGELGLLTLSAQRAWKQSVVEELLERIGGVQVEVPVLSMPDDDANLGLATRTRVGLFANAEGQLGFRPLRSEDIVVTEELPIAVSGLIDSGLLQQRYPAGTKVEFALSSSGEDPLVVVDGEPQPDASGFLRTSVTEIVPTRLGDQHYRVSAGSFWQAHKDAPAALVEQVLDAVGDVAGRKVLELYSGVGLFTKPLAAVVGRTGQLTAVEGNETAVSDAHHNVHGLTHVRVVRSEVLPELRRVVEADEMIHTVVLDPARSGAGKSVIEQLGLLEPAQIVHIACDPAALARDVSLYRQAGYELVRVTALDLFPGTHHIEVVALLRRTR